MATYVLRAAPETDLYVLYCDSGNQIVFVGDREGTAQFLPAPSEYGSVTALTDPAHSPEARLARADATGTSALWNRTVYGYDYDGLNLFWHRDLVGAWWLRRDRLAAYAQALVEDEDDVAFALLEPRRHDDDQPQAADTDQGSCS